MSSFRSFVMFSVFLTIISGCASQSSPTGSGEKKPVVSEPVKKPVSPATDDGAFLTIAAVNTPILDAVSFAMKAKSFGKPYTVFQFSGVTCESCKADSPKVQAELAKMNNVARVVVFPNVDAPYSEDEYQGFIRQYAPGAARLVDNNLAVLKELRKEKSQFFGLYVVVRSVDGKAFVMNESDAHLNIVNAVKVLK
ncbi:MAG: hypothetical protein NTV34_20600 [Proteobacteria bacterium]|nr:hypothetical protein [Pseudomonadota bacterium]